MTAVTDPKMGPETFFRRDRYVPLDAPEVPQEIMFDIDDVIFPTMYSIHDLALEAGLHDGTVEPRWSGWEVYTLPDGTPCPPEVYWDLWSDFAARGGYLNTPPIPEAAEAMRELYYAGHRIHLVTARGFMAHAQDIRNWTYEWVDEFAIPWHTLTFAKDKVAAQIAVGAGFDYAIDDSPKNVEALRSAGIEAYLLDHAHNLDHPYEHRVPSAASFAKIIQEAHQ
jgi:5'(3')-deoxyribonucleotidase